MLPVPPCIRGLVGCDSGDTYTSDGTFGGSSNTVNSGGSSGSGGGGSGINGDVSLNLGGSLDASGLRNGIQNGLNGLGNGASSLGSGIGNAGSRLGSAIGTAGSNLAGRVAGIGAGGAGSNLAGKTQRYAEYLITATNRGKEAVKGFSFTHGPLPFGAEFDAMKSSKECVQSGTAVQCTTDLAAGQAKEFLIAYKAKTSFSCALAKALQTVKTAASAITGAQSNVTTSVSCSMKNVPVAGDATAAGAGTGVGQNGLNTGSNGSVAGLTSGSGNTVGALGAGAGKDGLGTTGGANGLAPGMVVDGNGGKPGYKPYTYPRTGAADLLFSSTHDYVLLPAKNNQDSPAFQLETIILLACIALAVAGTVKKRLFA